MIEHFMWFPWELDINDHLEEFSAQTLQCAKQCFGYPERSPRKPHVSALAMDIISWRRGAVRALRHWFTQGKPPPPASNDVCSPSPTTPATGEAPVEGAGDAPLPSSLVAARAFAFSLNRYAKRITDGDLQEAYAQRFTTELIRLTQPLLLSAKAYRRNQLDPYSFAHMLVKFLLLSKCALTRILEKDRVWFLEKTAE